MATALTTPNVAAIPSNFPIAWTFADVQQHLGGIPIERIRIYPTPGLATIEDWERLSTPKDRLLELIDGVLVEKTMGYNESLLAGILIHLLWDYIETNDIGFILGETGPCQILPGQVRMPDVSFVSWDHFPNRQRPRQSVLPVSPDLAVEVLSPSNTQEEMDRKRRNFFEGGTRLVWQIDPETKTVSVFRSVESPRVLTLDDEIDGEDVLPGFRLSVREYFARAGLA